MGGVFKTQYEHVASESRCHRMREASWSVDSISAGLGEQVSEYLSALRYLASWENSTCEAGVGSCADMLQALEALKAGLLLLSGDSDEK